MDLWRRVWQVGSPWISEISDRELLLMTCESLDERVELRASVLADGDPRLRKALHDLEAQITKCLSLLGFTPTDRTRLGVAEVRGVSPLGEIIARRTSRRAHEERPPADA
jgi:hypothetical protein